MRTNGKRIAPAGITACMIGAAILGYREGDTIEWEVPAGIRRIRIREVLYQPEAAGQGSARRMEDSPTAPEGHDTRARRRCADGMSVG